MLSPTQKIKIADRRARVAHLKLVEPGIFESEIAKRLGGGVTQQTISNDLKAIEEEWKQSNLRDFNKAKAIELARLNKIYDELWKAWEKSKTDFVSTTKHRTKHEGKKVNGKKTKSKMLDDSEDIRREHQCGDPRYMKLLMENVQLRCEIEGILVKGKDESPSTPQIVAFNFVMPPDMEQEEQPKQVEQIGNNSANVGDVPDNGQVVFDSGEGDLPNGDGAA